jgi:hypothetical protein
MARRPPSRKRSSIEVQGVKVVQRQLRQMDDGTIAELKRVYVRSANLVYRNAMPRVPVRSGRLKETLRVSATTRAGSVKAGSKRSAPYAGPVHFGWPNRPNQAKEWQGGPIYPNPFLYSALDDRRDEVEQMFFNGIMKVARKAGLA